MNRLFLTLCCLAFLADGSAFAKHKTYKTKQYKHKHALGLKRDKEKHKAFLMRAVKGSVADTPVPAKMDLSPLVSPPEDQGNCGSCWAFALTKGLRSAWMLAGKDPNTLAFNYLVNNCGGVVSEYGCGGGDFEAGENFLNGKGPWLESQDPYHESDGGKCLGLPPAATATKMVSVGSGGTPTFKDLAQAISAKHMLVIDVAVCGAWGSYSDGIFNDDQCGANSINHMINLNGYDCETSVNPDGTCKFNDKGEPANGDGFLIVMNNWGTSWGEKGYMRTRAHVDAIADTAMYFEVDYTPPTPPTPPVPPVPPTPPTPESFPWWILIVVGVVVVGGVVILLVKKKS